jgi:sulfofructose kinase
MSTRDVVAIGVNCMDHVTIVRHTETGEEFGPILAQGGGLAATAACAIGRLGGSVELWAIVGDDHHGRMIARELNAYGVSTDQVRVRADMRTPLGFIEVDAETGDRTIYFNSGRREQVKEDELDFAPEQVLGAKALLVDLLWPRVAARAAKVAHEAGIPVVADIFHLDGPYAELVPFVDALILPEEAGELLIGSRDFPAALRKMAAMGPKMPAITCGSKGCYYYFAGKVYHCSAFKIRAVDTTGCGDSFHGAFAYALANGYDVHRSVRFASAVAALKATKQGGRSGLPTLAEVEQFIAARPDEAVVTEQ